MWNWEQLAVVCIVLAQCRLWMLVILISFALCLNKDYLLQLLAQCLIHVLIVGRQGSVVGGSIMYVLAIKNVNGLNRSKVLFCLSQIVCCFLTMLQSLFALLFLTRRRLWSPTHRRSFAKLGSRSVRGKVVIDDLLTHRDHVLSFPHLDHLQRLQGC